GHGNQLKFMTYNVWSREDMVLYSRMKAIGHLVEEHQPDVVFVQEVTPYIVKIFESFSWWKDYHCSPVTPEGLATGKHFCLLLSKLPLKNFARWKFPNSPTGRGYLAADIYPEPVGMKPIHIATAQLEPPSPPSPMHCMERYLEAEHAVAAMSCAENVVFGGDMSWDDHTDLPFPLPAGWVDAWTHISPRPKTSSSGADYGTTCDGDWVERIGFAAGGCIGPRKRSDKFVCKLPDYELNDIELIGSHRQAGAGAQYYSVSRRENLEFRPSCHYGLILTITPVR
ncbi:hypothetical protein EJB05_12333, partial [Eragrostis curvula]